MLDNFNVADVAIDKLINGLVEISQATKDVAMFDHVWRFKLLNSQEHLAMISSTADQLDSYARIYRVQIATLNAALVSIDGKVLTNEEKSYMFYNVSPSVIEMLFSEYDTFRKDHAAKISGKDHAAKNRGKHTGRKLIPTDWTRFGQLYGEWKSKNITGRDFMRRMDMSANTFYRRVREYELRHGITEQTSA